LDRTPFAFKVNFITKLDSYVLLKENGRSLHNYIHDTKREHKNRHAVMPSLDPMTLDRLLTMMYNINPYVKVFKMARGMMATEGAPMDLKLHLIAFRTKDARRYNVPMADEVAALMVGDGSEAVNRRDVVLTQQAGLF
jgi:hypothetical protein